MKLFQSIRCGVHYRRFEREADIPFIPHVGMTICEDDVLEFVIRNVVYDVKTKEIVLWSEQWNISTEEDFKYTCNHMGERGWRRKE